MTNIVATLAAQNRSDLIVTGDSDIVTAHSDDPSKSVTIKSESAVTLAETAVTLFRNERSRWGGICKLRDVGGWMAINALQDIDEVVVRIDVVQPAG